MNMKLTEEQVTSILEASKVDIVASLKKEVTRQATYSIDFQAQAIISETVTKWMKEEIVPEIQRHLIDSKESLIAAAIKGAEEISLLLSNAMASRLKENLEASYKRGHIFKALFE